MEVKISEGKNNGYCTFCKNYFKKGDIIIRSEKGKINKIKHQKYCFGCLLKPIAEKVGWKKLIEMINKKISEKI